VAKMFAGKHVDHSKLKSPDWTEAPGDLELLFRVLRQARPYLGGLLLFLVVSLLATPIALLSPVPLKIAVDSGLGDTPLPRILHSVAPTWLGNDQLNVLFLAAALVVCVTLLTQLQWVCSSLLRTIVSQRMLIDFRVQLFRHVQRLSFAFHDERGSSDSTYRIHWDATAITSIIIDTAIPLISSLFTLIAMIYVTFAVNWYLGLVALAVSPFLVSIAVYFKPRLRKRAKQLKHRQSAAFAVVPETLSALRVVKAFGQEDREQDRFMDRSRASLRAQIRYMLTESGMGILVGTTTALGTASVLYVGATQVLADRMTLGELLLVMSYIGQLYGPLKTLSNKAAAIQSHLASAERAFALLDEPFDVPEAPRARPLQRAQGAVSFQGVGFQYAEGFPVLRDVDLEVPAGSRVGIAGRTGAGKTTLISLLMRFYDVSQGRILLDGVDIREYKVRDLRRQFSIVLQDPVLFSTSLRENIAYGRPNASEEDIIEAAKAANAHDFIVALSDGYDTRVGERGMRLSGGERQRISLARAFLTDAPVLVLDEPTSSVDVNTEALIMEALDRLMHGRTTFMIAHRLSTLESCDLSVHLQDGKLDVKTRTNPVLAEV
jgi:ATP-binding cassette subfamily B protein